MSQSINMFQSIPPFTTQKINAQNTFIHDIEIDRLSVRSSGFTYFDIICRKKVIARDKWTSNKTQFNIGYVCYYIDIPKKTIKSGRYIELSVRNNSAYTQTFEAWFSDKGTTSKPDYFSCNIGDNTFVYNGYDL